MLTKRQIEDAAKCLKINCADCSFLKSLGDMGQCSVDLRRIAIAQTALAYRELAEKRGFMLKKLECVLMGETAEGEDYIICPRCQQEKKDGHAPGCELAALLKESEGEEG